MSNQAPSGYNGKVLRVHLSENTISTEPIDDLFCRKYLGGAGFVTYFLYKELPTGIDPLGPDNKLIFALGPLTGGLLPGGGRHCVGATSPLTGGIAKSEVGGFWGAELKRAGYDVIIIEGKAEKPLYLWVHDGEVNLRDASQLWGKQTKETQQAIRGELGDDRIQVALIGPAGEKLVRYACLMHGLHDTAGRGGLGAVMGSKNLKAIAIRGHNAPSIFNRERLKELKDLAVGKNTLHTLPEFGTGAWMDFREEQDIPIRNFRDGQFPGVKKISAQTMKETIRIKMDGCFGCPIRCKKVVEVKDEYSVDPAYGGPEYECLASLGSNCGIDNLKAIAKASEICNANSLDTISTGVTVAFAMECFERGLLTRQDTNGIELKFGNAEAMLEVVELIAKRQGIGDLLAEGVRRVSQRIGKKSEEFAMEVKGLEVGMHDPRFWAGCGLGFMVNPHGADHCTNIEDTFYEDPSRSKIRPVPAFKPFMAADYIGPGKVGLFRLVQLNRILFDSMILCQFFPYTHEQMSDALAATTGWDTGVLEQVRVAERILTMARLFNIRNGFTADDDKLPQRFFQPKTSGIMAGKALDPIKMEKAKGYYYTLMGWDAHTGIPTPEKLEELDII